MTETASSEDIISARNGGVNIASSGRLLEPSGDHVHSIATIYGLSDLIVRPEDLDGIENVYKIVTAYGIPNFLFMMAGGIFADRADGVRLLISTRIAVPVLIIALAILHITDLLAIWHIYAIASVLGTVQVLNMPARMALVADLVEREEMMNAVALHSMVNQTGQIIGPALAGGIIELAGVGAAVMMLVVALWLGIWRPVLRRLEA